MQILNYSSERIKHALMQLQNLKCGCQVKWSTGESTPRKKNTDIPHLMTVGVERANNLRDPRNPRLLLHQRQRDQTTDRTRCRSDDL